jgi:hypothetical protein
MKKKIGMNLDRTSLWQNVCVELIRSSINPPQESSVKDQGAGLAMRFDGAAADRASGFRGGVNGCS